MKNLQIRFLGTRGSMPVDSNEYKTYGGATVSVLAKTGKANIVFDAGTGFLNISKNIDFINPVLHIFVSHAHFDHIMGFAVADIMFNPNATVHIYGKTRNNKTIKQQIDELMRVPIWPVNSDVFKANVIYHEIDSVCEIDGAVISSMPTKHPGGCTMFKLEYNDKSVVYTGDVEIDEDNIQKYAEFCKNTDMLICDGQYSDEIMHKLKGYGHSSWQNSVKLADLSDSKSLYVFHHSPYSDDNYLGKIEKRVNGTNKKYHLARKGQVINL